MRRLGLIFLVLTACGGPASPPASAAPTPSSAANSSLSTAPTQPSVVYAIEGAPENAPVVVVTGSNVSVDGAALDRQGGLTRALQDWKRAHSAEAAAGRVAFEFERDAAWSAVQSLLGTAVHAGYHRAAFRTQLPKEGGVVPSHLEIEVQSDRKPKPADRELHVSLSSRGSVLLKWTEGAKQIDLVSSEAVTTRLAPLVERGWNERGLYREPNDRRFDQAVLDVERDTPYALLIVVVDALHAPKRQLGGKRVPALQVRVVAE